jgi:HEAT repeat protein
MVGERRMKMMLWSRLVVFLLGALLAANAGRGAAAAEPTDPVEMAIELLHRADADFRQLGLDAIAHATPGEAATYRYAAELSKLPAGQQRELLAAFRDRGDAAAAAAVTALLLASADADVRADAIRTLGVLGNATEVELLKAALAKPDPEQAAARRALVTLQGRDVGKQLADAARFGEPSLRPQLIDILADRRERSILPDLPAFLLEEDTALRLAAARFLGMFGGPEQVAGMVAGLLQTPAGRERDELARAVVAVSTNNRGHAEAAKSFLEQFKQTGAAEQEILLPTLGRIGGPEALGIIDDLVADPSRRAFGLKALTVWPTAEVTGRLFALLEVTSDTAERQQLLDGLIRIAPRPDKTINDGKRLELVKQTMALCQRDEDRQRLLDRTDAIRTVEAFRFVVGYLDNPALQEAACQSVVELAHHRQLRDAHKDEFMKALDRVIAVTKNEELSERANRYKAGKTWERKKA